MSVRSLTVIFFILLSGCSRQNQQSGDVGPSPIETEQNPYDFRNPTLSHTLPGSLEEISGLTLIDEKTVAAIQDEVGIVYLIDFRSGTIQETISFAGSGDFEGISTALDRLYLLRSDRLLIEVRAWQSENPEVNTVSLDLPGGCDAEGLTYDPAENRLLVACKESAGKDLRGHKALFEVTWDEQDVSARPAYVISLDDLNRFFVSIAGRSFLERVVDFFINPRDARGFKPSGLAVHPVTDEIYILSSVNRTIVVLSREGLIRAVHFLPLDQLPQPEGIAFLPNGDLVLSSEGSGGAGVLQYYNYQSPTL